MRSDSVFVLAFITWAKKEMESYGEIFRRQVYSKDVERSVVDDALEITYTQSRKVGVSIINSGSL